MATGYDAAARRKLPERIDALTADLEPRWGRMSVGQMVVHCDQQMRHSLGEHPTPVDKPIRLFPLNLLATYVLPTPKGLPTLNEVRDLVGGAVRSRLASARSAASSRPVSNRRRTSK